MNFVYAKMNLIISKVINGLITIGNAKFSFKRILWLKVLRVYDCQAMAK